MKVRVRDTAGNIIAVRERQEAADAIRVVEAWVVAVPELAVQLIADDLEDAAAELDAALGRYLTDRRPAL